MKLKAIGRITTPYRDHAPFRPEPEDKGLFCIEIFPEYEEAMQDLARFSHIIVLFYFDRSEKTNLKAHPPHLAGKETGLFASRSPNRVNKIGINVVKIRKIENNLIYTSPMDALDGTPLLDIKPYIPALDCHSEADPGHIS